MQQNPFGQVIKAEMEYQKDIDRFMVDIGETKVKTALIASPTGYIWSATSGGETIFSVKKVKHNGLYYSIVNSSKVIEKLNVSFYFDSLDIKEYEFKVSPVTEEQLLKINQNDFSDFENF